MDVDIQKGNHVILSPVSYVHAGVPHALKGPVLYSPRQRETLSFLNALIYAQSNFAT